MSHAALGSLVGWLPDKGSPLHHMPHLCLESTRATLAAAAMGPILTPLLAHQGRVIVWRLGAEAEV